MAQPTSRLLVEDEPDGSVLYANVATKTGVDMRKAASNFIAVTWQQCKEETQNKTADSSSSSNVEATASSTGPGKDLPSASTVAACAAAAANQAIVGGAEVATVESEQCVEENGAECAEKTLQGIYINTHGSPLPSAIPTLTLSSATVSRQGSSAKSSKSANAGVAVQQL
eukprot:gene28772-26859_t